MATITLSIPLADGNPDSRVYAYEVEVAGEGGLLYKAVYAAGCNMGIGHETNGGITTLEIPYAEISSLIPHPPSLIPHPPSLIRISVRPLTSLGTAGGAISAKIASPVSSVS